ncbi:hypothetical protein ACFV1L_19160 [Kitasatospora sp. NPDC059646]|uniref:hypothetical protein n=1 Tax=Kitasatospora sp. NPDC059646 TaxID=3346893 RepID=UPI003689C28D
MRMLTKIAAVTALAIPMFGVVPGVASATTAVPESVSAATPAGCSSVTQIGVTGYVTVGGQTMASVKQYKGCGKNYAYMYVWQGYRDTHSSWQGCTSIVTGTTIQDVQCNDNMVEIWSSGADTLSQCTQAIGWNGTGPWPVAGDAVGKTDVRC